MEGMRRPNMVSFLDWTNKFDDYSELQEKNGEGDEDLGRTRSGMSSLSVHGGESDCSGDDLKRRFEESDPGMLRLSQYKDVIAQPNGRMGAQGQIYEKHQRIWLQTFNEKDHADIAALKFRGVHGAVTNLNRAEAGHPQNRFLREGEMVDMLQKHTYEDQLNHTKITTPTVAARAPYGVFRAGMAVKLEEEKEVKRGEEVDKSESLPGKDKSGREHMFDKAVTPSDVGKLNRLVIPKQHAEKYFPLDTNANEKGLLLNFEDNTGKTWRFRYSYWNSSQSYVLTKGWSRFVKEKKLDAGDIVSFERGTDAQNIERLFISWRRRPCVLQSSKAALLRGLSLPSFSTSPGFQYGPFQSHGLNIRAGGGKLGQGQHVNAFPEWMSVVWSPNNDGASSRPAPMWAEQTDARQPQPIRMDMRFHAEEGQNSAREPLDFMQLKTPPGELPWPIENASVKSSKKGVRLFGVNL